MKLSTKEAIQDVFQTALKQELMGLLKHDHEWKRFHAITDETKQRVQQEEDAWQSDYHKRFAEAQQVILRETHGNILTPPKPEGVDAIPNKAALDQKADQRIRQDHQRRIGVVLQDEIHQLQKLRHAALGRDARKNQVKNEFEKVRAQTRSGPSRS